MINFFECHKIIEDNPRQKLEYIVKNDEISRKMVSNQRQHFVGAFYCLYNIWYLTKETDNSLV